MPTAIVVLLAMDSVSVTQTITGMDGAFVLQVPKAGTYLIQVSRIGLGDFRSSAFTVGDGETVEFEISAPADPVELAGLVVEVVGNRGRDAFSRRRDEGRGVFLDPGDLALRDPQDLIDLFRDLEGVRVVWSTMRHDSGEMKPTPTVRAGANNCMAYMLDKLAVRLLPGDNRSPLTVFPLSTLQASDIMAVEIYRSLGEAPEEIRNSAFRGVWGRGGSYEEFSCGVTVFRTKPRW